MSNLHEQDLNRRQQQQQPVGHLQQNDTRSTALRGPSPSLPVSTTTSGVTNRIIQPNFAHRVNDTSASAQASIRYHQFLMSRVPLPRMPAPPLPQHGAAAPQQQQQQQNRRELIVEQTKKTKMEPPTLRILAVADIDLRSAAALAEFALHDGNNSDHFAGGSAAGTATAYSTSSSPSSSRGRGDHPQRDDGSGGARGDTTDHVSTDTPPLATPRSSTTSLGGGNVDLCIACGPFVHHSNSSTCSSSLATDSHSDWSSTTSHDDDEDDDSPADDYSSDSEEEEEGFQNNTNIMDSDLFSGGYGARPGAIYQRPSRGGPSARPSSRRRGHKLRRKKGGVTNGDKVSPPTREQAAAMEGLMTGALSQLENIVCRVVFVPGCTDPMSTLEPPPPPSLQHREDENDETKRREGPHKRLTPNSRNVHGRWMQLAPGLGCLGLSEYRATAAAAGGEKGGISSREGGGCNGVSRAESHPQGAGDKDGNEAQRDDDAEVLVRNMKGLLHLAPSTAPLPSRQRKSSGNLTGSSLHRRQRPHPPPSSAAGGSDIPFSSIYSQAIMVTHLLPRSGKKQKHHSKRKTMKQGKQRRGKRTKDHTKRSLTAVNNTRQRHGFEDDNVKPQPSSSTSSWPESWPVEYRDFLDSDLAQRQVVLDVASPPPLPSSTTCNQGEDDGFHDGTGERADGNGHQHPLRPFEIQRGNVRLVVPGSLRKRGDFALIDVALCQDDHNDHHEEDGSDDDDDDAESAPVVAESSASSSVNPGSGVRGGTADDDDNEDAAGAAAGAGGSSNGTATARAQNQSKVSHCGSPLRAAPGGGASGGGRRSPTAQPTQKISYSWRVNRVQFRSMNRTL